jgi:hypothetical protein
MHTLLELTLAQDIERSQGRFALGHMMLSMPVGICPSVLLDQIMIFTLSLTQWLQKASKMEKALKTNVLGAFYPGAPGRI